MNLTPWVRQAYSWDGWWTCLQFDLAVSWFGRYVESRLMERDSKGNAVTTLEDLLKDGGSSQNNILNQFASALKVVNNG